jgi:hypothetical protein
VPLTYFGHDGSDSGEHHHPSKSVCIALIPEGVLLSDRTLGLVTWNTGPDGLGQRASVEHSKRLASHCALPAQHMMGG